MAWNRTDPQEDTSSSSQSVKRRTNGAKPKYCASCFKVLGAMLLNKNISFETEPTNS